ncbi:MAG: hypothetical protein MUE41_05430 [Gemmatimonadaceae bacterium]|jgi:hypothetical protein|nr:hypothetical protein [Gemmatimonadaceae bacterium]
MTNQSVFHGGAARLAQQPDISARRRDDGPEELELGDERRDPRLDDAMVLDDDAEDEDDGTDVFADEDEADDER